MFSGIKETSKPRATGLSHGTLGGSWAIACITGSCPERLRHTGHDPSCTTITGFSGFASSSTLAVPLFTSFLFSNLKFFFAVPGVFAAALGHKARRNQVPRHGGGDAACAWLAGAGAVAIAAAGAGVSTGAGGASTACWACCVSSSSVSCLALGFCGDRGISVMDPRFPWFPRIGSRFKALMLDAKALAEMAAAALGGRVGRGVC